MAARTRYLLTYDIRDPRRLRRVHQIAKDFGEPLQYSVFLCDLTRLELARLRRRLNCETHHREDSIAIIDLGPASGTAPRRIEFIGASPDLPNDDPFLW